jgi:AraC-like DNA-binding protein
MGWIPAGFVQPVSILVGIVYGIATLVLISLTKKRQGADFVFINRQSLVWLNMLSTAVTLYFVLQLYQYLNLFINNSFDPPSQLIKCVIGIMLFTYFITTPNVQENMDGCILPKGKLFPSILEIYPHLIPEFKVDQVAMNLDKQVKESKAYLSAEYDLSGMAKDLEIPISKFPKLIKKYYGVSFVEFLNRLRIHHFLEQRSYFDQFTLETYMYQSGFSNRSTFYAAFKKYVGVNPSFYLKEMAN